MPLPLEELYFKIDARLDEFEKKLGTASAKAKQAGRKAGGEFSQEFTSALRSASSALTWGVTAPVVALGKAVLDSTINLERMKAGLTGIMGSAKAAYTEIDKLRKVSLLPGIGFSEAVKASQMLQAIGVQADYARRMIVALGNANALAGGTPANLEGVVRQLQQMISLGRVTMMDIRPMIDQIPQIAGVLQKQFGTSNTEAIQKMFESGKLTMKSFVEGLVKGLEDLPKVQNNLANEFDNMKIEAQQAFQTIGEDLAPTIHDLLKELQDGAKWWRSLDEETRKFWEHATMVAAVLGPGGMLTLGLINAVTNVVRLRAAWLAAAAAAETAAGAQALAISRASKLGSVLSTAGILVGGTYAAAWGINEILKPLQKQAPDFVPDSMRGMSKSDLLKMVQGDVDKHSFGSAASPGGIGSGIPDISSLDLGGGGRGKSAQPDASMFDKSFGALAAKIKSDQANADRIRRETAAMRELAGVTSAYAQMQIRLKYGLEEAEGPMERQAKLAKAMAEDWQTYNQNFGKFIEEHTARTINEGLAKLKPVRDEVSGLRKAVMEDDLARMQAAGASPLEMLRKRRELGLGARSSEGQQLEDLLADRKQGDFLSGRDQADAKALGSHVAASINAGLAKLRISRDRILYQDRAYSDSLRALDDRMQAATSVTGEYDVQLNHLAETYGSFERAGLVMQRLLDVQKAEAYRAEIERLQQTFEDFIDNTVQGMLKDGFNSLWSNIIGGFEQMLAQMARDWIMFQIRTATQSAIGSLFGGLFGLSSGGGGGAGLVTGPLGGIDTFGPGLASGGPAIDGRAYLVGERGPELFVPNTSGFVMDNGSTRAAMAGAGGGNVVVNVTVHASDAGSFVKSKDQIASEVGAAIARAQRRSA